MPEYRALRELAAYVAKIVDAQHANDFFTAIEAMAMSDIELQTHFSTFKRVSIDNARRLQAEEAQTRDPLLYRSEREKWNQVTLTMGEKSRAAYEILHRQLQRTKPEKKEVEQALKGLTITLLEMAKHQMEAVEHSRSMKVLEEGMERSANVSEE
ncbi:MAG: hypothetical protein Q9160_002163 [Pyrenula sp. 1 TL-2023]